MNGLVYNKKGYRWQIVSLLFLATTINYIDRQIIGILKPFIEKDLGWSEADYGFIVTAFQIAYALGLLLTGSFLDRVGSRIGYVWAMIIWSIAGIAHAAVRTVNGFIVARFALGLGESANFPTAVKSVAEWFPKKERALATGIFNAGSTVGAILTPIIISGITLSLGWRMAFIITGALGFFWVGLWLIFYRHPSEHKKISKEEFEYIHQDSGGEVEAEDKRVKWAQLFKFRQTGAICFTRFISDWVWWFFLFWIPDFLIKNRGIDIKELVLPLIIIYAVSSLGGILGGWLSSRFIKTGKTINYARKTTILLSAMMVLPIVLVSQVSTLEMTVGLIALAAAGHQSWASNIFTIISDIYPKRAVGAMMGLSGFAGAIGGALAASFVGLILGKSNSYTLIFVVASIMYVLNWIIIKIFIPKIEPIQV